MGMNRNTGDALWGHAHIEQSITDILTTPIGSRVMRRDYGSRLFEFVDAPVNANLKVEIVAAVAEALDAWEPRVKLETVTVEKAAAGRLVLDLDLILVTDGTTLNLKGIAV